ADEVLIKNKQVPPERIVLFGRSLGAAVAGTLASQRPAAGLILESAFPSVAALARFHYWGLPMDWLVSAEYNLADRLRQVRRPILVIHGDRHTPVPLQLRHAVFEPARPQTDLYVVPAADPHAVRRVGP